MMLHGILMYCCLVVVIASSISSFAAADSLESCSELEIANVTGQSMPVNGESVKYLDSLSACVYVATFVCCVNVCACNSILWVNRSVHELLLFRR